MNQGEAYLSGRWLPAAELTIPIDDLGFTLGITVVERLRTFHGQPFHVEGHIRRLRRSLEIVGWSLEFADQVQAAIDEFMRRNAALIQPGDDWAIVAFITPGATAAATDPTVCVHGFPLPFANWAGQFDEGVAVAVTAVRQTPGNCWPSELKCRSRMHYYLADQEAARRFPGARALLLDQAGNVGEASTANIVCYFAGRGLVTPWQDGILPGISQAFLFEIADQLGIAHAEADIPPARLHAADEVFLTSTSVCVLPVVKIDDRPLGDGAPGPVYKKLLAAWSDRVGLDVASQARRFATRV